jgi:hypothetical protein
MSSKKSGNLIMGLLIVILLVENFLVFYSPDSPFFQAAKKDIPLSEIPSVLSQAGLYDILFIVQNVLCLILFLWLIFRLLNRKSEPELPEQPVSLPKHKGNSKTDIDLLYDIIKQKKRVKIGEIARVFTIDREKALDWCRILENNGLVAISYPAFSESEIILQENNG